MEALNRRDFLKAGLVASSATAAACTYDYKVPAEKVLPYVANPENVQPGLASYYAGLCNGCATACGIVARNKDGRVVHVEGNPDHPSGAGGCAPGIRPLRGIPPHLFKTAPLGRGDSQQSSHSASIATPPATSAAPVQRFQVTRSLR